MNYLGGSTMDNPLARHAGVEGSRQHTAMHSGGNPSLNLPENCLIKQKGPKSKLETTNYTASNGKLGDVLLT